MSNRLELQNEIDRLARIDFGTFVYRAAPIVIGEMLLPNWHIDVLIRAAERVADGDTRHLLACLPPRYLKTYIFSICLPAWLMGRNPRKKIISASYGMSLAEKFNLDVLALMTSPWYRRVFPHTRLNRRKVTQTEITTTAGGFRLASSVGGTLTGRGGDLVIIDDPMKADEAHSETARENVKSWFFGSVGSRLNDPKKGAFIVVAQRLHAEDLPGALIEHASWDEVIIPAINDKQRFYDIVKGGKRIAIAPGKILQPSRHDAKMLAEEKKKMGDHDFEAQYNQNPLPPGGAVFKAEWFMGGLYRSAYEEVAVFCTDKSPATNNVQLGANGRDRMNVWEYAGANRSGSTAGKALGDHPTPKPIELVVDALLDVTRPGDIVLDPFMGSGTTILACDKAKRLGRGIEMDPGFVDVAILRWQEATGQPVIHAHRRMTFDQLAEERRGDGLVDAAE